MNKLKKLLLISSALLLSTANNTFAVTNTATASIAATGTISSTCSVTASGMSFGALGTAGTTTAVSTVTPNCTLGTSFVIKNAADNNYLLRTGGSGSGADSIEFPITLTGGSDTAFTLANAATIKLIGTGTGDASALAQTLTGTAVSSTGKNAGSYTGTVTLTLSY
jgi:spore coat protein U-like protein